MKPKILEEKNEEELRRNEHEKNIQRRKDEGILGKVSREIKEVFLSDENYIGERDMSLFKGAGYDNNEISWISQVKHSSNEETQDGLNAYDLIRIQAMMARDFEGARKRQADDLGEISEKTEQAIEEALEKIMKYYDYIHIRPDEKTSEMPRYTGQLHSLITKTRQATSAKEKASLFTRWLGLIHSGGNREVLSLFGGYPESKDARDFQERMRDQQKFLDKLNQLGKNSKI